MTQQTVDHRQAAMQAWLEASSIDSTGLLPLAADASSRRYFRLPVADGSRVVMDAPDQTEACRAFLQVRDLMAAAGLHVPRVEMADPQRGFMVLEDLGSQSYLAAFQDGQVDPLMEDALSTLVRWQAATRADPLPRYDHRRLRRELDLFPQWYVQRHLGLELNAEWWARWHAGSQRLVEAATRQPQAWVHRDFMARNLLVSAPNPGVIDFQDAMLGPVTYDLVSLLRDAFFEFSPDQERYWIGRYAALARTAGVAIPDDLPMALDWMGAQRHLKVLGVFARLHHRDDKPRYLTDASRFVAYLDRELSPHAALADLHDLIRSLPAPGESS
ncbi:phosphotransferase [Spiribacter sp. 2438]|uniref:aminoglycoside phosphotransferase family protein n=1 Tax=Spiribacter sp. 2438 TaxID=2666185 RepID=UPI0012AFF5B0|nr:phosphotransferase [Spiribacter sp. 2438]QGM22211.1 phosphotransferase [Spiribacter sp. 2438]